MSSSKKKHNNKSTAQNETEILRERNANRDLNESVQKEFATYNRNQRIQIVKLADALKEFIADSENKNFKEKCESCLEKMRAFTKLNKDNPCKTEKLTSDRLCEFYRSMTKIIIEELYTFEIPEVEDVKAIISDWHTIVVTVEGISSERRGPQSKKKKKKKMVRVDDKARKEHWGVVVGSPSSSEDEAGLGTLLKQLKLLC